MQSSRGLPPSSANWRVTAHSSRSTTRTWSLPARARPKCRRWSTGSSTTWVVDNTPWHWFAYFHGLRIAELGTAYKTMIGEFPAYFEYGVGIPDFLFGVSAFWIGRKAMKGEITEKGFLVWNLVGALVIVRQRRYCCSSVFQAPSKCLQVCRMPERSLPIRCQSRR